MMGFHPDLRYTIDFSAQMVIKSFNVDVNLENYSKKRSAMSKYIVAPSYDLIDAKQNENLSPVLEHVDFS